MKKTVTHFLACASVVGAAIALVPARPAAQQQNQQGAQPVVTREAMDRAQAAYQADLTRQAIARDKNAVVDSLMERWRDDIGENPKALEGFRASFLADDPEKLVRLTQAKTWDAVTAVSLGFNPDATIGSKIGDLVFTPVTPCRAFDSRFGTGAFAGPYTAGQTVSIYVTDSLNGLGTRNQGGAANCGFPFNVGSAVALNITVVPITGSGDLKIFPFAGPSPNSSIINFYSGLNLANATSAGIALNNPINDLSITVEFATSVHIVVDIMGYYSSPLATSLDRLTVSNVYSLAANGGSSNTMDSPACPSGYVMTGGGADMAGVNTNFWWWQNGPGDSPTTFWRARGRNNDPSSGASVTVSGVCARIPGR